MRLLLVEHWDSDVYAEPYARRFREYGHEVLAFKEYTFFDSSRSLSPRSRWIQWAKRAQAKCRVGPSVRRLNQHLVGIAREFVPDVVFVFRGAFLWPRTVERLRTLGSVVIAWNNDDPFGPRHYLGAWRHFLRSVPHYDFVFAYRQTNLEELRRAGAKGTDLLRSSYVREINRPIENVKDSPYSSDISFIGHWEPDCREEAIAALMAASDIDFRLFGPLWERSKLAPAIMARWGQLPSPRGSEYNLALCSAKIALIFLSRLNRDTYTRRCFEIPAAGVFMLSEFTPEIAHLFEEDKEIVFFRSTVELLEKTRYYLTHEEERRRIAKAGRERLLRDGHEVGDRAIQILHLVETRFGQRLRGDSPRVGSEM